ncbi:hypothetical protein SAMN05428985_11071 [Nocardioides sp. YR527]|nr:hypothetical protein SAMN05428985_11071 [Nocardioides sp. YR527]
MGGTRASWINEPANLITLCGSGTTGCHGWVEANPTMGRHLGLSVSRYGLPPAEVPVLTWRDGFVLLDNHGGWTLVPEADVPDIPDFGVCAVLA